jgi:hypothetical protein
MHGRLVSLIALALAASACTIVHPAPQVVSSAPAGAPPTQQQCREYTATATIDGRPQETVGTACLDPDGTWRIVDAEHPPGTNTQPQSYAAVPAYPVYPYPYYYPYPYWGPAVSLGFGFRFGGHHHHHFH